MTRVLAATIVLAGMVLCLPACTGSSGSSGAAGAPTAGTGGGGTGGASAATGGGGGNSGSGGAGGGTGGAGSGGVGGTPCALGFLGDPSKPPILELRVRNVDAVSVPLVEGGTAPLITPPQGGRVIFLGVRATNISPCSVQLIGSVRDTATQQVRVDGRSVNLTLTGDGWGVSADSNISTFANVPVCANQWASTDIHGHAFEMAVSLTDPDGRTVEKKVTAVPACAEPGTLQTECACICKLGYKLGDPC